MPSECPRGDPPNSTRNPGEFFAGFDTSYSDDKPDNSINEIYGQSADINKSYDGDYVWLIPRRASVPRQMVDNIWIDIQSDSIAGRDDLAKGAGGDYRYCQWSTNMAASNFITEVGLWRSGDSQNSPPSGWERISGDINRGRGGDYLYFVWRTKAFVGPRN